MMKDDLVGVTVWGKINLISLCFQSELPGTPMRRVRLQAQASPEPSGSRVAKAHLFRPRQVTLLAPFTYEFSDICLISSTLVFFKSQLASLRFGLDLENNF